MEQNNTKSKLEMGKQIGKVYTFELNGEIVWSSVAIQKWEGLYKVYIDEISESKMDSEDYQKEILEKFQNLDEAIFFLEKNSNLKFNDLTTLSGQKIFNPAFD